MTNTDFTARLEALAAQSFYDLVSKMANVRREYAAANGFTVTDDELAADIKKSIRRMIEAAK